MHQARRLALEAARPFIGGLELKQVHVGSLRDFIAKHVGVLDRSIPTLTQALRRSLDPSSMN